MMRALTIRQPWAGLIAHGTKRVENRTWSTAYRGLLLIHAGAQYADYVISGTDYPDIRSAVVAVATLTGCHPADGDCCGTWGESGVQHWTLDRVQALPEPVPTTGRLGLWTPPKNVQNAVRQQLPAVIG